MNLKCLKNKLIELNEEGIPIPLLRDNVKNRGSVTLTMFVIAFNVAILALVGKVAKMADGIDYSSVLLLLTVTGSFYLGRSFNNDGKKVSVNGDDNKEESKE